MKQIADPGGSPSVFILERDEVGLRFRNGWALPALMWDPDDKFVFRFRKSES